jgi:hypothetical protein
MLLSQLANQFFWLLGCLSDWSASAGFDANFVA